MPTPPICSPKIIRSPEELQAWRGCALVPTMGALHAGHTSLMTAAVASGCPVVVSIFVNPTQFGDAGDLRRYPRTLEADLEQCAQAGVQAVFVPDEPSIYPSGVEAARQESARWPLPSCARTPALEDRLRPGHFGGVCQVVARLFDLTKPALAVFGEKVFQQLRVVTQMVEQSASRWGALRIVPSATIREPDGLAMSSRNRFLSAAERSRATGLWKALQAGLAENSPGQCEEAMRRVLHQHQLEYEYSVVRDSETLAAVSRLTGGERMLIAARLGAVRLIDNHLWKR